MSEITTGNVVGTKPTTQEIIALARKQGAFKPANGSGEASQPKDGASGRSLATQANEANKRTLILKTRMEGVEPERFSYSASLKRFNDLQQTTGVMNLVLAGIDISFISVNPFNNIPVNDREHSLCLNEIDKAKEELSKPDSQHNDTLARLKGNLEDIKLEIPNEAVSQEIDEIIKTIDSVRSQVLSSDNLDRNVITTVTSSNPTSIRPSEFSGITRRTSHDYHNNRAVLSANAFACADIAPENAQEFKKLVQETIQRSWSLAHKLAVVSNTQNNMQEASNSIQELKHTVRRILQRSDNLLMREQHALKVAQKN